jgi:hypothetical protein
MEEQTASNNVKTAEYTKHIYGLTFYEVHES